MPTMHDIYGKLNANLASLDCAGVDGTDWVLSMTDSTGKRRTVGHIYNQVVKDRILVGVNAHAALVEALTAAEQCLREGTDLEPLLVAEQCRNALALADKEGG
jgi:hypothetical protein